MKAHAMKRLSVLISIVCILGLASGCKKDDGGGPITPTPTGDTEPNDVTPQSIGILGTSDILTPGIASSDTDIDRFAITIPAGTNLHVSIAWQGTADLNLGVMNPGSIMINYQGGTTANPERCTLPAQSAGTYVIEVTSQTAASTAYTLTVGPR